jgi:hypothetical protein
MEITLDKQSAQLCLDTSSLFSHIFSQLTEALVLALD